MDHFPGHERREERRARRHRRLVRSGETFSSDELDAGTVELEEREPGDGDGREYEPWGRDGSKDEPERDRERLRAYLEFVAGREREDPAYQGARDGD